MYRQTGARRRNEAETRTKHSVQVHGISQWAAYTRESERIRAGEIGLTRRCLGAHTPASQACDAHTDNPLFSWSRRVWFCHQFQFQNQSQHSLFFHVMNVKMHGSMHRFRAASAPSEIRCRTHT